MVKNYAWNMNKNTRSSSAGQIPARHINILTIRAREWSTRIDQRARANGQINILTIRARALVPPQKGPTRARMVKLI